MNIAIRVDASNMIGTGHVMRCLNLADEFSKRGCIVTFICREFHGHLKAIINKRGYGVILLPIQGLPNEVAFNENLTLWNKITQNEDSLNTVSALERINAQLLIVDHYSLDYHWEGHIRHHTKKILVIDDLVSRNHECDVLIDQNFSTTRNDRYKDLVPDRCEKLLGPKYALLSSEFVDYRKTLAPRSGEVGRILVFFGGSDKNDMTRMTFDALSSKEFHHIRVDIVVGANYHKKDKLFELAQKHRNIYIHLPRLHLADLMAQCDLSIGAGGVTTLERMCLGLPSLVVSLSENQIKHCYMLSELGLINYIGNWRKITVESIKNKIKGILVKNDDFCSQSKKGMVLVDGYGTRRIVANILPNEKNRLRLRIAKYEDALIFYNWVNDPLVRANSVETNIIPLDTHMEWFKNKIHNLNTFMFVMEMYDLPVGQIRFEILDNVATLDYSIDSLMRGRGWGTELVRLGINYLKKLVPATIIAKVKSTNLISANIFLKLGFDEKIPEDNYRYFTLSHN